MGNGTASADPAWLEAAVQAVQDEMRAELIAGHQRLDDLLATFSRGTQSPDRIAINPSHIASKTARAYTRGNVLDQHLIRAAGALPAAGDDRPPGVIGPLVPSPVLDMDEAAVAGRARPVELVGSGHRTVRR
jgi:hypothetical protein